MYVAYMYVFKNMFGAVPEHVLMKQYREINY
jgi:hypothetical protein